MSDPRLDEVFQLLLRLAGGELEARGTPSEAGDDLDAILLGLNMLAEELGTRTEELRASEARFRALNDELETRVEERTTALQRSDARSSALLAALPFVLFRIEREGRVLDFHLPSSLRLPPELPELVGLQLDEIPAIDAETGARLRATIEEALRSGAPGRLDLERPSGIWETVVVPAGAREVICVSRDVTAERQAAAAVRAALHEKEALLREIHHRVKNNLQVVSSLMRLQLGSRTDPALVEFVTESQARIAALALVHEHLYGSDDLSRIEVASYVNTLAANLVRGYGTADARVALGVSADGGAVLPMDQAIPCGLIVTEAVSNSLKHGFPGERRGHIWIGFASANASHRLSVRDNGVGLPAGLEPRRLRSLGMKLMHQLSRQLHGVLELRGEGGTEISVTFPQVGTGVAPAVLPGSGAGI
ncbi:MAG: hypothetical protein IT371_27205 [Deltaproteobacteria bacterium]|nr:hypothetical protein [Deltaproteobacteria bacterium]